MEVQKNDNFNPPISKSEYKVEKSLFLWLKGPTIVERIQIIQDRIKNGVVFNI